MAIGWLGWRTCMLCINSFYTPPTYYHSCQPNHTKMERDLLQNMLFSSSDRHFNRRCSFVRSSFDDAPRYIRPTNGNANFCRQAQQVRWPWSCETVIHARKCVCADERPVSLGMRRWSTCTSCMSQRGKMNQYEICKQHTRHLNNEDF